MQDDCLSFLETKSKCSMDEHIILGENWINYFPFEDCKLHVSSFSRMMDVG